MCVRVLKCEQQHMILDDIKYLSYVKIILNTLQILWKSREPTLFIGKNYFPYHATYQSGNGCTISLGLFLSRSLVITLITQMIHNDGPSTGKGGGDVTGYSPEGDPK